MNNCFYFHIKHITPLIEKQLQLENPNSWDELLESILKCELTDFKKNKITLQIEETKSAIKNKDWNYFQTKIENKEHFKFLDLTQNIGYIDIETTGLSKFHHEITTIGIYDGNSSKVYVQGIDLEDSIEQLKQFDIIVTFNGKQFDIPFIEHNFNTKINALHLDLRFMLKEFNLTGGLKRIERELGLTRDEEIQDIDGFEAIRLWKRYKNYNDNQALEKLKKYNIEDIENLEILLNWYISNKSK